VILWRVNVALKCSADKAADIPANSRRWLVLVAMGVLLVGLLATALATVETSQAIEQEARARFDRLTERLVGEAARRINQIKYGLAGATGVYAGSKSVECGELAAYVSSRNLSAEFPGAIGIGFIQRVMRTDLDAFVAAERADGATDFSIRSMAAPGSPLENATDLYVSKHCFPKERNAQAWGLDIGSYASHKIIARRSAHVRCASRNPCHALDLGSGHGGMG